ncbi:MAG TPA: hypothetical protein VFH62_03240 [Dehalococcoidia bacterium]|nr:hypothetical protein [Dehalococcoidia bacterium]
MAVKADEVRHPDQIEDDFDWDAIAEGERPDESTHKTLRIAHRALAKFPEMRGRYKAYAGAAAVVSSAATVMAGVAIARKMKRGMSADRALAALTAADFENAIHVAARDQRYKRLLRKIIRRRKASSESGSE